MKKSRPNPDELLASVQKEEAKSKKGKLKIFLGMCPGVGKTYAMLQAARQRTTEGIDVLIGVAETHGRKETEALIEGLVVASKVERPYKGTVLQEMDLDTILMIRPQMAVVDELAHTNAPGSRHPKRYQDVFELLAAGIDVYTTLNVQHVESRAEAVAQITGIRIQETVPDSLLDEAEEIILIDLSPEQLRQRLKEGKVYMGERATTAAENFFREENLTALREMALRLTAERVNQDLREIMTEQRIPGPWKAGECLMVAVGATPFSESLIRWTRRSAASMQASWIAVYVETSDSLAEEDKKRLMRNLTLARQLGAEVIVRSGTDVAETLLEVARQNNVSQICIGKPLGYSFWQHYRRSSFIQQLIRGSGDIDIHMVRVKSLGQERPKMRSKATTFGSGKEYGIASVIVVVATLVGLGIEGIAGYSSVSLLYLLSVVLAGMILSRWPVLLVGALSAVLWNYLFIPPKYTFWIFKPYDAMMFFMYFVIALVMGHITSRLREREKAERKQEERVNTLYQLTRIVAMTHEVQDAIQNALSQLEKILNVRAGIFLTDEKGRSDFENPRSGRLTLSGKEKSVATWAFQKRQPAGRFTETLPDAENFYLPLVSMDRTLGILAMQPAPDQTWGLDQRSLVESFASLMTVIVEKESLIKIAEEAKINEQSEKLQTALLDSVSHELKTPLAVIEGSAEHLDKDSIHPEDFRKLVSEIRIASKRLRQTVDGLLDMTRLDSGRFQLNLEWHDMRDVINSASEKLADQLNHHKINLNYAEGLPLVKIDSRIMEQVLVNLLSNAVLYTPQNVEITVSVHIDQNALVVTVMDQGSGIPEEDIDKIFEKFYRGKNTTTGGLGIGLSIVKRFVEAHSGEIEVHNREEGGACFTIRLPVESFEPDEKVDS
jgi:two-component system sensor histidine kinase KdpD